MAISLKHSFSSGIADGGDTSLIQPSNWNAEHALLLATGKLVGRTTTGTGAAEEITPSSNFSLTGGVLDLSSTVNLGTSGVAAKLYINGNHASNIYALTDASTIAVDMSLGNNFSVTLAGNRTLGNPTNLLAGQSGVIFVTQDSTGNRTLAYSSYWKFPSGGVPTLSTTGNLVDALVYTVRTSTSITVNYLLNIG